MNIHAESSPHSDSIRIIIDVANTELSLSDPKSLIRESLSKAAAKLATTYIEENKMAILEKISPEAVANLAIADSAKLVREQFIDPDEDEPTPRRKKK